MSLIKDIYTDQLSKLKENMANVRGGVNVRVNGGATVGAPPTQVAFNPILIALVIGVVVISMFTNKRR